MKKILALTLALLLVLGMTACGGDNKSTGNAAGETTTAPADEGVYSFPFADVELIPGAPFDPAALPEASFLYEVPSCAIEGTDKVYNYDTFEVTAFDDGTGAVIYSIYLIDANTPTAEGLYLGDDAAQVEALYGTERTENGTELVYQKGSTMLIIILDNDAVISIEYRMVTE